MLEGEPVGAELVSAYAHMAGYRALTGRDAEEAIEAADRASALSVELGLPEPAFALHFRGVARTSLGDAEGIDDLERALRLAIDQGLGRETGVIYGNLTGAIWEQRGPAAALATRGRGSRSARRGASPSRPSACAPPAWPSSPSSDKRRTPSRRSNRWPPATRRSGDKDFTEVRVLQARLLAERGTPREPSTWTPSSSTSERSESRTRPPPPSSSASNLARSRSGSIGRGRSRPTSPASSPTKGLSSTPTCFRRRSGPCSVIGDVPLAQRLVALIEPDDRARRACARIDARPAGRGGWGPRRGGRAVPGGSRRLAGLRERPRARLCPPRPGSLSHRARRTWRRGAPDASSRLFAAMGYAPALAVTEALLGAPVD